MTLEADYRDLCAGEGRWADTPEGHAARRLLVARSELADSEQRAASPATRRRDRRAAARSLGSLRLRVAGAEEYWSAIGTPAADGLSVAIAAARDHVQRHETVELLHRLDAVGFNRDRGLGLGRDLGR